MHEQPQPTEEEEGQAPERLPEEEPDRDERSADEEDRDEPIHDA